MNMKQKLGRILVSVLPTFFLSLVISSFLSSCGGPSPEDIAEKSIGYLVKGDVDSFYNLLSSSDKSFITQTNFKKLYRDPFSFGNLKEKAIIPDTEELKVEKFDEIDRKDSIAMVSFVANLPDYEEIGKGYLSYQDVADFILIDRNAINKKIISYIKEKGLPTEGVPQIMTLVKEQDEWRVFLDLENVLKKERKIFVIRDKK